MMSRRPKIAIVSPVRPVKSGIADYVERLLPEMSDRFNIFLFADNPRFETPRPKILGVQVFSISMYPILLELESFDMTIVAIGNNPIHERSYQLLKRYPVTGWCHDVWLGSFFSWKSAYGFEPPLSHLVAQRYGHQVSEDFIQVERLLSPAEKYLAYISLLREKNIFVSWPISNMASQVWVHSRSAAEVVKYEADPRLSAPVFEVPFAFPEFADEMFTKPNSDQTEIVISTFGIAAPEKGTDVLLEAFGELAMQMPNICLRIVGPVGAEFRDLLRDRARELQIENRVEITGEVSEEHYRAELGRATIAVQLRTVFNGEASAAVSDTLSAGIPTIVSKLGWMASLPREVVVHVDQRNHPRDISSGIRSLLLDREGRERRTETSREFASRNSFSKVGTELGDLIEMRIAQGSYS